MLPPAAVVRADRIDRPSEIFAPEARGLRADASDSRPGTQVPGLNSRTNAVMQPPVALAPPMGAMPSVREDYSPSNAWSGGAYGGAPSYGAAIDVTRRDPNQQPDAFSKSGFSFH